MEAVQLFLTAFDHRWDTFRIRLDACRKASSEAAVHDLRVAARRLLAFVEIAHLLDPHPRLLKIRRALKDLIDGFDELRDVQVMLALLDDHSREVPELAELREHLQLQESQLLRTARKASKKLELQELQRRINRTRVRLDAGRIDPVGGPHPFQAVDSAFAAARLCDDMVDLDQPVTLHRLRLAFKKFRYRIEIIHPALPGLPEDHLARMHAFQARMGDIQDADSFLVLLAEFADQKPEFDSGPSRAFYEQLRRHALAAFVQERPDLKTFWRAAPDRAFPWSRRPPRHKVDPA
jgi:CHAD domain-containing protein